MHLSLVLECMDTFSGVVFNRKPSRNCGSGRDRYMREAVQSWGRLAQVDVSPAGMACRHAVDHHVAFGEAWAR